MTDKIERMTLHAAIARALVDNGTEVMFGLIGDANLFIVNSFVREFNGRYVSAANEAGALLMGLGYASVSGKIGVVTVTHGPGLTNTVTGLVEGAKARLPLVLLCGDTAIEDKDNLQNVAQREIVLPTGAGFEQARAPHTILQDVATALRRAWVERRPIVLNVPINFQWEEVSYKPVLFKRASTRAVVPESEDIDNAIGLIASARQPLVLAGRGAMHARASLKKLADRTGAFLATTLKARALFQGEPFDLGIFGTLSSPVAVDAIMASDCILAFGASLNNWTTSRGALVKGKRIIQCDLDPQRLGANLFPDAALVGDAELVADTLVGLLEMAEIAPSGLRDPELACRLKAYVPSFKDSSTDTKIDLRKALIRIRSLLPKDRVVVMDGGRFMVEAFKLINVSAPEDFLFTTHFGSIGMGMPSAVGASRAAPSKPVVLLTGDGGFMLGGLAEFNTAVRHGIDLIVIVCNDGSYGAEYVQFRDRQMDPRLSLLEWPDFAAVAEALGGQGITFRTENDIAWVEKAIDSRNRPLLIDVKLNVDSPVDGLH